MFGCISCHIANYIRSVDVFDEKLRNKLEAKFDDPEVFSLLLDEAYYNVTVQNVQKKVFLNVDKDCTGKKDYYICKTCKLAFLANKLPSRCILNDCKMTDQPDSLKNMTEVEVSLISQNLQFRKIHRLPRSLWAQCRDRTINVPVPTGNIKNTIASLPRNPTDSGLIGVNWKRKKSYKNTHKTQLVDVNRLFDGLEYLIDHNPLYRDSAIDRDFIERCKVQDPSGHEFFITQNDDQHNENEQMNSDEDKIFLQVNSQNNKHIEHPLGSEEDENEIDRQDRAYNEYAKTDPIRRFQFDYDESVALANDNPAAALDGNSLTKKNPRNISINNNNFADVAPGEGQIPTSVLREKEWYVKTYPHLYPDGRNGMNGEGRKVKLTNQQYIKQRLFNVDKRFANDPAYLFSATWFIENQQLERNISMSYTHGSKKIGDDQSRTYQVNDPFCVFQKISNTPQYWKTKKMELLSKLDNKGPFQFFFTLSCADARWEENFASLLHELDLKVTYVKDNSTDEIKTMITIGEETITLQEYLNDKRFCNDTRHTQIRKNVLTATRNFDNRVKEFMKHIVMSKDNPMNTKLYNYRVEFQARGAGHIHGVLWVDFDKNLPNDLDNNVIKSVFNKFRHDDNLLPEEEEEVVKYIDTFVTCTSDKE